MNTVEERHPGADDVLNQAIEAFQRETRLNLALTRKVETPAHKGKTVIVDAMVRVQNQKRPLAVVVKRWAQHVNAGALIDQVKALPGDGLLAADYVNPRMAAKLRDAGVQFIDVAGNAYIHQPPVHVYVNGNRAPAGRTVPAKGAAGPAFEPKGLMVIFALLRLPGLINAPYREIAQAAGVALGTVTRVLDGLRAGDFVRDRGQRDGRRLCHLQRLANRWVEIYPEKLKPKQAIGEFVAEEADWWTQLDIKKYDGFWGGEIAAAKLTKYLKPAVATVYLPRPAAAGLLRDARLRKAPAGFEHELGTILLYEPFWPVERGRVGLEEAGLVHPLLAYADLIATADPRNREAAQRLYDEQLAEYLGED